MGWLHNRSYNWYSQCWTGIHVSLQWILMYEKEIYLIAFAFEKKQAPVGSENTKIVYWEIQEHLLLLNTN